MSPLRRDSLSGLVALSEPMRVARLIALTLLVAVQCVSAETWAPEWVTVVRPQGQLIGVVQWDQYLKGRGEPGLPYLLRVKERSYQEPRPIDNYPSEFRGEQIKGAHRFGDRLILLMTDGDGEYLCGGFLVVLDPNGIVKFSFTEKFEMVGVGAILPTNPRVVTADRWAVIERAGQLECIDLESARSLWTRQGKLGPESSRRLHLRTGLWARDETLFLSQEKGLFKLDARSGKTLWRCPMVGPRIFDVTQGPDGNEYVTSIWYPQSLYKSLKRAASEAEPSRRPGVEVIVPHRLGDVFFASVKWWDGTPDRSVWEYVDHRWKRIFDYNYGLPEKDKDVLFKSHQFSSWMRKRLEISW